MTNQAKRLALAAFKARAEPALTRVFASFDGCDEPFSTGMTERLILEVDWHFNESEFQALCSAAAEAGDDRVFFSLTKGYLGGSELIPYYTCEIPLFDYEMYLSADRMPYPKDHDIGIPIESVLWSPQGTWGVLLPDTFVLVGGEARFMRAFKQHYQGWEGHIDEFLKRFSEAAIKRNADVTWVPGLLRHIYGDDAPGFSAAS